MADEALTNSAEAPQDSASRARAALGGSPGATRVQSRSSAVSDEHRRAAEGVWSGEARRHRGDQRVARFQAPEEVEFEFNPPASPRIPNSNVPLTIGLLFSIVASFVVFFAGLASGGSNPDPILPAFWRALGALAVLVTLSFAASWFMPEPVDRRKLLDRLDAEDKALGRGRGNDPAPVVRTGFKEISPLDDDMMLDDDDIYGGVDEADKGSSVDMTVDDDFTGDSDFTDDGFGGDDDLEGLRLDDDDDFYSGAAQDDFATTSPALAGDASLPAVGASE